jgi:hypothetical protein
MRSPARDQEGIVSDNIGTKYHHTFEHRMMQMLNQALKTKTTAHIYGSGFHLTGIVTVVNDRLVEMRLGDKTTLVRFDRIDAVSV